MDRETEQPPVTVLGEYLSSVRSTINLLQQGRYPARRAELQELQNLEQFATALQSDLTGTGPHIPSLDDEQRNAYQELFMQPAEDLDLGEEDRETIPGRFLSRAAEVFNDEVK